MEIRALHCYMQCVHTIRMVPAEEFLISACNKLTDVSSNKKKHNEILINIVSKGSEMFCPLVCMLIILVLSVLRMPFC